HGVVGDAIVLVLRQPGGAKEKRDGDAVLQADPGVAPGLHIWPVGALAHQRMAAHEDAVDRFRRRRVTGTQLETGIDYRKQHDPAWIGLVRVVEYLPALADAVGYTCEIGRVARHRREPVATLDRLLGSA